MILSAILDQVTALGSWREVLPSHWQFAWLDAVQPQISWGGMVEGAVGVGCYAVVLVRPGVPAVPAQGHRVLSRGR